MNFDDKTYTNAQALAELYHDTSTFNEISGGSNELSEQSIAEQFAYIEEEFQEFVHGHLNNDLTETTDGIVDTFVTLFGYMQKIQKKYGIDFAKAMELIGQNNLDKYPCDEEVAIDTVEMYKNKGVETYYTYNPDYDCYVIRDKVTNKVKKPIGFKGVDLSSCFPTLQ